jgi:trimethylamine--corrinoid protein Co-methyltransferase
MAALAGSNLNHDVGYMDFGRTGSLEMIVILDEIIDEVRRLCRGIVVDDEMLALDVIREVGSQSDFLTHPHTLKHLRQTQWRPKLTSRMDYEKWQSSGANTLLDRAKKRLHQILETHQPMPLAADVARRIQNQVDAFVPN